MIVCSAFLVISLLFMSRLTSDGNLKMEYTQQKTECSKYCVREYKVVEVYVNGGDSNIVCQCLAGKKPNLYLNK